MEHHEYSNEEYDVIVIGGGLSGVTAAYTIVNRDPSLELLLIEKTDHLGGRRYSTDSNTFAFVSNTNYFMKELLKELNIPLIRRKIVGATIAELESGVIHKSWTTVPLFGNVLEKTRLELFLAKVEEMCREVSITIPHSVTESEALDKISMETFICTHLTDEISRVFMRNVVYAAIGLEAKDISALFYIAYSSSTYGLTNQYSITENGVSSYILQGGATKICEEIKHLYLFDINYREKVISIARKDHCTFVATNKELFKCSHVVVALSPTSIFEINILPGFTETRTKMLKNMIQSNGRLVFITFNDNIFAKTKLSGDIFCGLSGPFIRFLNTSSFKPNSLTGITCEPRINFLQLEKFVNKELCPADVTHLVNQSIAVPAMGDMKYLNEIRRPLSRVFWAGSCTSTVWYGHEEGAVHSGIRAGIELLYDYKPQALSVEDVVSLVPKNPMIDVYADSFVPNTFDHKKLYLILLVVVGGVTGFFIFRKFRRM